MVGRLMLLSLPPSLYYYVLFCEGRDGTVPVAASSAEFGLGVKSFNFLISEGDLDGVSYKNDISREHVGVKCSGMNGCQRGDTKTPECFFIGNR
jgi:hypothetical protein